ncbi:RNA recognition motif 2-domain-containing protein [Durotheca rogersii]|uniref:RNA recognition motif 2-domain-containing protein n=1 Tax=Durotheca rogersii TaxID=419775 RepID=UPI00221FCD85|nr:RNA recognition motif 2-domain-containing protein [Durotheca rogersii]KAI5864582.1 RNA recognition motif 2-domain-containing protein [Durotheca rogersii]
MNVQQSREGHFNPASPHSSSGAADSFNGTPDTRLSAFSPEDGSARSTKTLGSLGSGAREAGPIKYPANSQQPLERSNSFYHGNPHLDKDPFITSSSSSLKTTQKLSPTASTFFPLPSNTLIRGSASEPKRVCDDFSEDLLLGYGGRASGQSSPGGLTYRMFVHDKPSTDAGISRCLVISTVHGKVSRADIELYLNELQQAGFPFKGSKEIYECGEQMFIHFSNIRDACTVSSNLAMGGRDWIVRSVTPREFSQVVEPGVGLVTAHEGQLYLSVFAHAANAITDPQQLEAFLKDILQSEGDLFALQTREGVQGSLMSAVVEYCDNEMSLRAVSRFNGVVVNGLQMCIVIYRPDIQPMLNAAPGAVTGPARPMASESDLVGGFQRMSLSRPQSVVSSTSNSLLHTQVRSPVSADGFQLQPSYGMMPVLYHGLPVSSSYVFDQLPSRSNSTVASAGNYSLASPMASQQGPYLPTDLVTPRQFQQCGRPDGRRQNAMRVARSPYYNAANHHNHVDVGRIREGIDVRTTIMLRNIPNKVDQTLLKRIVDESSWGKYDFMYLRIDFANDCNVGYAFINFVDPLDIIDFVNARGNQRWNCFKSDKVAEISYATIQGKDCLVQKFRNSSVMLEAPHYRPKLFYTLNGPRPDMAGQEEPFPEPDNQSKMKRSCENAEHVGLFTPHAGQHFRDEQRRRRSQFDRGTRLAALEEYDYNTAARQQPYYTPQ